MSKSEDGEASSVDSPHQSTNHVKPHQHQTGNYQTLQPSGVALLPIALKKLLIASHSCRLTQSALLCDPNVLHIRSSSQKSKFGTGDWAWGCGYRNLQMLFSTIIDRPDYQSVLSTHPLLNSASFSSSVASSSSVIVPSIRKPHPQPQIGIPSIRLWQEIVEDAWKSGFDPEGAAHFSSRLIGKRKWIGTTEAYVALSRLGIRFDFVLKVHPTYLLPSSSFSHSYALTRSVQFDRLRCQIVDFPHPSGPNGQHTKLIKWVEDYFKPSPNLAGNQLALIHPLLEPSDYDQATPIRITNKFPLYFQHDGHSRTIIGIETGQNHESQLLILDPAKSISSSLKKAIDLMISTSSSLTTNMITTPAAKSEPTTSSSPTKPTTHSNLKVSSSSLSFTKWISSSSILIKDNFDLQNQPHQKLLNAHRLNLKQLSKKSQYQILYILDEPPIRFDKDQTPFHIIKSIRIE